ncbi:MAG: hypothetical protein ACRD1H_09720, partial [Vicinamibacterales bacterium]
VVAVAASLASTYAFTDWFVARSVWVGGLSAGVAGLILAAGTGYVVAGLTIARRRAVPARPIRPKHVAGVGAVAIGSLLAAPALALALSATVVDDDALAPLNQDIADISVLADESLRISPGVLRAGSNWYMLSNSTDRHVGLTMVPIDDDADVDRLLTGDQQNFTFMTFADAAAGQQPTLGRLSLDPGRYAVYVTRLAPDMEEGAPVDEPIDPSALVVIDVEE